MIVNNIEEIPGISYSSFELSKYRVLLKPIIAALVMQRSPISEGIYLVDIFIDLGVNIYFLKLINFCKLYSLNY